MSAKRPTIELKADVWEGLGEFLRLDQVGNEAEVAAGLFGYEKSRDHIVVERVVPNEHLDSRDAVALD